MSPRLTLPSVLAGLALSLSLCPSLRAAGGAVWFEAESPARTNLTARAEKGADVLSEGRWIGFEGKAPEASPFLEYDLTVSAEGTYRLYARKFWKHGPFRWRVGDQPWQSVDGRVALLDEEGIRPNWVANWTSAGEVKLATGKHTLRIEIDPEAKAAFFDCFLLTTEPFFPMGRLRPDQPLPAPAEGFSTFSKFDTLFAPSPIDLRGLNEKIAGERGPIGAQGDHFVQAGKPVRFLAVGSNSDVIAMPRDRVRMLAKFLARKGVNLVRHHSPIIEKSGPNAGRLDDREIDNLLFFVEALKQEGIYTHLSIYFPLWFRPGETGKFPGLNKDSIPFALQFFNPEMQQMQKDWWRGLLARKSPYSGKTLAEDPAVMGVEILNEDSFFYFTFDPAKLPAPQIAILEAQFAAWAEKQHGSLDQAATALGAHPRDHLAERRLALLSAWEMGNRSDSPRARASARFLAEVQRAYFDDQYNFIKRDLGFVGVVCGSNWRTASTRVLGALDKWTQLGADFLDHHGYYGGAGGKDAQGRSTYALRSLSAWDRGLSLPFLPATFAGKPAMVSEYSWIGMNDARAEMPLLTGALASQSGVDALVLFSLASTPAWRVTTQHNWPVAVPSSMGLFPSKALTFRLGLVPETAPVTTITVNTGEMFALKGNEFIDPSANDANRSGEGRDTSESRVTLQHLAHGKVLVQFTDTAPTGVTMPPAASFHDTEAGVLRSADGNIEWPYQRGVFTVRAPQTQAVSGKLAQAGDIDLPDLVVQSPLEFGVVWATAMDGQPLATSRKILLQAMTHEQNHGFVAEPVADKPGHKVVTNHGTAPIEIRNIEGTVSFKRPDASHLHVTALDINGAVIGSAGTADRLVLQPGVIHYLIESAR